MADDRQMPLALGAANSLDGDDLIVTPSNQAAASLIGAWPHWSAPLAVIVGPPGSGKTHLAAIWKMVSDAHAMACPWLPDDDDRQAAAAGRPILCDGLVRDGLDEAGLFHMLNAMRGGGGTMLITARQTPGQWQLATPDLSSRLRAAMVAMLDLPDDALLRAVAVKLFADRQIVIDPSVVDYIVARMDRSLAALIGIVDRLDQAALARKSAITRPLAAQVLRAAQSGNLDC